MLGNQKEKKPTLVSYIPDLKVVDATLRDGGLVNNLDLQMSLLRIYTLLI